MVHIISDEYQTTYTSHTFYVFMYISALTHTHAHTHARTHTHGHDPLNSHFPQCNCCIKQPLVESHKFVVMEIQYPECCVVPECLAANAAYFIAKQRPIELGEENTQKYNAVNVNQ